MNHYTPANVIKTCITYFLICLVVPAVVILLCLPLSLLPTSIRHDNRLLFFITSRLGRFIIWASFIRVRVQGKENLPAYPNQPSIIVINHASALDIPLVEAIVGSYPHIWMSKTSYAKIPIFGFVLQRIHVTVERGGGKQHNALHTMYNVLKGANRHALIFPEGRRHSSGHVSTFYSGFAMLSQKLDRPVIPVIIEGLHAVFPAKSLVIDSSVPAVKLSIGNPLHPAPGETVQDFTARVQKYFETEMQCSCDSQT